jgi:hypothetical protein
MENAPNVIIPADLLLKILEKSVKSTVLVIFFYHHVVLRLCIKFKSLAFSPLLSFFTNALSISAFDKILFLIRQPYLML